MSGIANHVADYLALRRSLGFKLVFEGYVLPQLATFCERAGSATVTTEPRSTDSLQEAAPLRREPRSH